MKWTVLPCELLPLHGKRTLEFRWQKYSVAKILVVIFLVAFIINQAQVRIFDPRQRLKTGPSSSPAAVRSFDGLKSHQITKALLSSPKVHDNRGGGQDGKLQLEKPGVDPSNGESALVLQYLNTKVKVVIMKKILHK
jgi:hypothetical protein